jgi:hypothetical protein
MSQGKSTSWRFSAHIGAVALALKIMPEWVQAVKEPEYRA